MSVVHYSSMTRQACEDGSCIAAISHERRRTRMSGTAEGEYYHCGNTWLNLQCGSLKFGVDGERGRVVGATKVARGYARRTVAVQYVEPSSTSRASLFLSQQELEHGVY